MEHQNHAEISRSILVSFLRLFFPSSSLQLIMSHRILSIFETVGRTVDTFDDVISTAVATLALGSGTASLALRGGVVVQFFTPRVRQHP